VVLRGITGTFVNQVHQVMKTYPVLN